MKSRYDVIIIGAGIGGLAAGVLLSKKGYSVLIIEQQHYAGGYCSSFKRGKFIFDSAAHVVGSYDNGYSFRKLLDDLEIKVDLIKLSPVDRIRFKDEEPIVVPSDCKEYEDYLKARFNSETLGIESFFKRLHQMTNPLYAASVVKKFADVTYQQYLDSIFKDPELKGILSAYSGFVGLPPAKVSALSALFTVKMFIIEGAYYPRGGFQALPNAFVERFKDCGGDILLDNEVTKILVSGNGAGGVQTKSGNTFESRFIISNVDCKKTFLKLLDTKYADSKLLDKLKSYTVSMSCFVLYLATNDKVDTHNRLGWYYSSFDVNKSFKDVLYLHIPTTYDSSLSPKGTNIIIMIVPYTKERKGDENWAVIKKELTGLHLKKLEKIFPGLGSNILEMDAATPASMERYTANSQGAAYGWEQFPRQTYLNAFPSTSSIENLFLAGHWTLPGEGVVSAALSGAAAARKIIASEKS